MNEMHKKHRARLDEKILEYGIEVLEEHELLEFILFTVIPRADTNKLAHRLLDEFGTVSSVLATDYRELVKVKGVGSRTAKFLATLPQILGAVQRITTFGKKMPHLSTYEEICEYMPTFFFNKLTEVAYIFCLNASDSVTHMKRITDGATGKVYIHERTIAKEAILSDAVSVIVAHNHPGGILLPSVSDVKVSRAIYDGLKKVDIKLKDSVIVSGGECFSMREAGYISDPELERIEEEARKLREKYENFEPDLPEYP